MTAQEKVTPSTIDRDVFYRCLTMAGVAWSVIGPADDDQERTVWGCDHDGPADHDYDAPPGEGCPVWVEIEQVPSPTHVRAVMVGDDTEHLIDVEDLVPITEDEFCHGCGQMGRCC